MYQTIAQVVAVSLNPGQVEEMTVGDQVEEKVVDVEVVELVSSAEKKAICLEIVQKVAAEEEEEGEEEVEEVGPVSSVVKRDTCHENALTLILVAVLQGKTSV